MFFLFHWENWLTTILESVCWWLDGTNLTRFSLGKLKFIAFFTWYGLCGGDFLQQLTLRILHIGIEPRITWDPLGYSFFTSWMYVNEEAQEQWHIKSCKMSISHMIQRKNWKVKDGILGLSWCPGRIHARLLRIMGTSWDSISLFIILWKELRKGKHA